MHTRHSNTELGVISELEVNRIFPNGVILTMRTRGRMEDSLVLHAMEVIFLRQALGCTLLNAIPQHLPNRDSVRERRPGLSMPRLLLSFLHRSV
ncbi:hypothetical protein I7I48_02432 [Histoplasma ohiense]|nr:hypothetical protein I7I48_02432 [Histoplasma ohiense (nom. inval.)]